MTVPKDYGICIHNASSSIRHVRGFVLGLLSKLPFQFKCSPKKKIYHFQLIEIVCTPSL